MLHKQQIDVSVINPAKVRAFAKSEGVKAKTDPIDAKLLLKFAEGKSLRLSSCPGPVREEISELMDRRSQLSEALTKEKKSVRKTARLSREMDSKIDFFSQKTNRFNG